MTTAVDTNILLDIIVPGAVHGDDSQSALDEALEAGPVIICEPVYAELSAQFIVPGDLDGFLSSTEVRLQTSNTDVLWRAGMVWVGYTRRRPSGLTCSQCGNEQRVDCERCGAAIRSRQHIVADFIIGAHALVHADRLLTRDRGFCRTYFPDLVLT